MTTIGDAWPKKAWEKAAEEARSAIRKGAYLPQPKAKATSRDVRRWKSRVAAMHRLAAGGRGHEINKVALASVLRRVG